MERAIELAKECFDEGEVPVGAVIVKDETVSYTHLTLPTKA